MSKHFTVALTVRCYTSSWLGSSMLENKQKVYFSQQQKPRDSASGTVNSWAYQYLPCCSEKHEPSSENDLYQHKANKYPHDLSL